ncbi:MAG: ribonuclease PH [Gemmataceae bacterium]
MRPDGRQADDLRPVRFRRHFTSQAPGSVLVSMGRTTVLCTCSVEESVPAFLEGTGKGWLTAEYSMLPGSTAPRKQRERSGKLDGRTVEIQRLIGRSLRAALDLDKLGPRTLWVDCDVLEADGGTRTASINGAFVAVVDAILRLHKSWDVEYNQIVCDSVAAVSVGLVQGQVWLDLSYEEDKDAEVDLNLVMTGSGRFVEIQAGGEEATFTRAHLERMLRVGRAGIVAITAKQKEALGTSWPF